MPDLRRAYKRVGKEFVEVPFWDLKKGDFAKLQESTGEWVNYGEVFLVLSDPYKNKEGIGTIQVNTAYEIPLDVEIPEELKK
jgi:hypothetical protein